MYDPLAVVVYVFELNTVPGEQEETVMKVTPSNELCVFVDAGYPVPEM